MSTKPNPIFPVRLSWEDVFNTTRIGWGSIDRARSGAKEAGYPYFVWNDRVYHTETGSDTCIYVENVFSHGFNGFIYDISLMQEYWIGKKITKISGKPFKSKEHVNTIKDVKEWNEQSDEPTLRKPAFIFEEDSSTVECFKCKAV